MKIIVRTKIVLCAVLSLAVLSCSDDFLEEKKDFSGMNEETFENMQTAQAYVDYIYRQFFPGGGNAPAWWDLARANDLVKTSDEAPGRTRWNQEWAQISPTQNHAMEYIGERLSTSNRNYTYTRLKSINMFLENIELHDGISDQDKALLKGQMFFWRGWQYMDLMRFYGGVPIALKALNPIVGGTDTQIPRSTSAETLAQALSDFDKAIELLPGRWPDDQWGRVTSGAAAAFKGQALLLWASPQFNRSDDQARWQLAYDANVEAREILEQNGFGMWTGPWDEMWLTEVGNPEAVFVYGYNSVTTEDLDFYNGMEPNSRSADAGGSPNLIPTKNTMDLFPMADGKPIGESTTYDYDLQTFYKNRDPRFYATFVYNGAKWPFAEDEDFVQWEYRWYSDAGNTGANIPEEVTGENNKPAGIYIKKWTDPNASSDDNFSRSGTDWMELRFTEVLMNIAEAATGIGQMGEAKQILIQIRERAGVENTDGSYGLGDVNGRDAMFGAILNERAVEFAYEGKRHDDLRRWMLFNDDYGTVSRLGLEPISGTRRQGIVYVALDETGQPYVGDQDPFLNSGEQAPIIDREPETYPEGITTHEEYVDYLYENYFEIRVKDDLDPEDFQFQWYNEYYFYGFPQDVMDSAPYLEQTEGWGGSYNPLSGELDYNN
ncbi:RagB/SusD family nutrient uptake outer membrane protein [Galbibacter sp.]|uniref:RagB/SusD family nutrient uptake outer membrane protein n=1 Tax=Galbibacter sp. TaxID=2918471 RepID=UPI003A8CB6E3